MNNPYHLEMNDKYEIISKKKLDLLSADDWKLFCTGLGVKRTFLNEKRVFQENLPEFITTH